MKSVSRLQKNQIMELKSVLGDHVPDRVLLDILKQVNGDVNEAINLYFQLGLSQRYDQPRYQQQPMISEVNI